MARRRWIVVAAAVAAGLAAPAPALAGSYDVVACNAPGAGGVNRSWTGAFTSLNRAPEPQNYDVYDGCKGADGGLVARSHVGGTGNAGFLTGAAWSFDAPAGTRITHVTVWRYGVKYRTGNDDTSTPGDEGDTWFLGAQEADGNTVGGGFGESCEAPAGTTNCSLGAPGGVSAASQKSYDVNTTRLSWEVFCRQLYGGGCPRYYGISTASMTLYGARVTLTDTSAPSLSLGGPLLAGGWQRPSAPLAYDGSDNSGIRSARIESGGLTARDDRPCDFTRTVPCANVSGGRLALPALPDGRQNVHIVAEDAAGNAVAADRAVAIDGTAPLTRLLAPRGRTIRVHVEDALSGVASGQIAVRNGSGEAYRPLATRLRGGTLSARLDRSRPARTDVRVVVTDGAGNQAAGVPARFKLGRATVGRRAAAVRGGRLRVPYGRRALLRGRLVLSAGQPLAGATITALARVRRSGAPQRVLASVGTDRRGRFTVRVPPGPSRAVILRFEGRDQALRAVQGVSLRVPATSTIRASRRSLSGPARVRFSGRLRRAGQPIGPYGELVVLQGRSGGHWQTFADTRTDRRGAWHASYSFRGIPGRYPVRLKIRRQPGYPFELGYSPAVTVRVR